MAEHWELHILSSRSAQTNGIVAMYRWCESWLSADVVPLLNWPISKPPANMTIDDRAFCFEGEWPDPVELRDFLPWGKR